MAEIHHFEYGWITPALSYAMSVLGSLLGLTCAVHVRAAKTARRRAWWLILAAWAIGGTGIWTMHFMAMLGFGVVGSQIRYDLPLTTASAAIAVIVVGVGLFIVGLGRPSVLKIIFGGLFTGLGVAGMHYTGIAAMRMDASIDYDRRLFIASIVIAVVAATVALWLCVTVRSTVAIVGSALVMGVAVNGMHFTGMAAMSVHLHEPIRELTGPTGSALLVPIILAVIFGLLGLIYAVLAAPTEEDRAAAAYLEARIADRLNPPLAPTPAVGARTRGAEGMARPTRLPRRR